VAQLTVHRKFNFVDPELRAVFPVVIKVILSASGPASTTLTPSSDKSYTRAIIRIMANESNAPTDGRLLRMITSSIHPSSVPIGRAVRPGISIVSAG